MGRHPKAGICAASMCVEGSFPNFLLTQASPAFPRADLKWEKDDSPFLSSFSRASTLHVLLDRAQNVHYKCNKQCNFVYPPCTAMTLSLSFRLFQTFARPSMHCTWAINDITFRNVGGGWSQIVTIIHLAEGGHHQPIKCKSGNFNCEGRGYKAQKKSWNVVSLQCGYSYDQF